MGKKKKTGHFEREAKIHLLFRIALIGLGLLFGIVIPMVLR